MPYILDLSINWVIGLLLYIVLVSLLLMVGVLFFKRSREKKGDASDVFFFRLSLFFLIFGISYILRIIMVFIIPPNLDSFYHELYARTNITQNLSLLQIFILFIGVAILSLIIETSVLKKKTKYIITLSIILIPLIIYGVSETTELTYEQTIFLNIIPALVSIVAMAIFVGIYLYIGLKNKGILRKKSFSIAIGLTIMTISLIFNSQAWMAAIIDKITLEIFIILVPGQLILSVILLFYGYKELL